MAKILRFPPGFLWGSSTSAYQVEGGIENCDWAKAYPAGMACDHYNRYQEDFDLLKSLNQNTYRFSIEWSRIEPQEGRFDEKEIEHYRQVILALRKRGIEPFVGLWHWTTPLWLTEKGGWVNKKINYYFHDRLKFPFLIRNENKVLSDLGWEIYPEGIYYVLKNLEKYQKPIYITENGLADDKDSLRKDFIKNHLYWIHKAIQEKIDVKGYFHWSFMDNFEWDKKVSGQNLD